MVSLAFLVCRPEAGTSGEVSLVWEAWGTIKSSYVEADTVDSKRAASNMIREMLVANDKPVPPFLRELEDVRVRVPRDVPKELGDVWRAWTLFREKWPDVDPSTLADAAVQGLLDILGDDFVEHVTSEGYDRAQEKLKGTYQGIGAFIGILDGKIVLSPMEGSPAQRADLKAGDLILEVDGVPADGISLQDVVDRVRGPAGSKVILLIDRPDEENPLEIPVIRGNIDMVSVDRRLLPGAIGYIYISEFQGNTPDEVLKGLEELKQVDMLALILDLRGNPGGSIESAQDVATQFLSDGLFMYEVDRRGNSKDWPIKDGGIATEGLPMLVMVNEFTGSAAEAVAGALQDAQRAEVLGSRTLGKGSASKFVKLSDGSAIYIPVSYWYTPTGRLIQGIGIEPDINVALTAEDRFLGRDSQLVEAYNYLNSQLPHFR